MENASTFEDELTWLDSKQMGTTSWLALVGLPIGTACALAGKGGPLPFPLVFPWHAAAERVPSHLFWMALDVPRVWDAVHIHSSIEFINIINWKPLPWLQAACSWEVCHMDNNHLLSEEKTVSVFRWKTWRVVSRWHPEFHSFKCIVLWG